MIQRRWPAGIILIQVHEFLQERRVFFYRLIRPLKLEKRGHQILRHIPPAEVPKMPLRVSIIGRCEKYICILFHKRLALPMNRSTFAISLIPGADSTPLDVSTICGRTDVMPSLTLSGFKPPDNTTAYPSLTNCFANAQSDTHPLPPAPCRGFCASTNNLSAMSAYCV